MDLLLAIDQGTTATTAILMDTRGRVVAEASQKVPQRYPDVGFVEHSADEIKKSVQAAVTEVIARAQAESRTIIGIGLTNQRETTCLFDRDGRSPHNFIVWQCRRSDELCQKLIKNGYSEFLHKKTGLQIDPYFSASKLSWLFEHYPMFKQQAKAGELLFGTIDSFLCHWLSGGQQHITDVTNASRTMLMDLASCTWSAECLEIFDIPKRCLPQIVSNLGPFGVTKGLDFLPDGIPIAAMIGDQQGALFGQACFDAGSIKATFGTGCFILMNTGETLSLSRHGLLTSVAYSIGPRPVYCLEGSTFVAGAAVEFLMDAFGLFHDPRDIEALALTVPDNGGVTFVPSLCGLGAPYWRAHARGIMTGLTRGTRKGHIARATLEGIALQNADVLIAMASDAMSPTSIKVDGGASLNNLLMQIQADVLGIPCVRPSGAQKTAQGAAYLAGLALGCFSNIDFIKNIEHKSEIFLPKMSGRDRTQLLTNYHENINKL